MRILLVEDSATLNEALVRSLRQQGWVCDSAADGLTALQFLASYHYDAVLLDLMLPCLDGWGVLRKLRTAGQAVPVLVISARDQVADRVQALDNGADDYLVKPFALDELLARLRALLRRLGEHASAQWQCGDIVVDTSQARVLLRGQPLVLTSHEYKLLSHLMQRKGEVLSRTELAEHLYPDDSERDSNTIEVFIARLRKKLPEGSIETVRGLGYRLVDPSAAV